MFTFKKQKHLNANKIIIGLELFLKKQVDFYSYSSEHNDLKEKNTHNICITVGYNKVMKKYRLHLNTESFCGFFFQQTMWKKNLIISWGGIFKE